MATKSRLINLILRGFRVTFLQTSFLLLALFLDTSYFGFFRTRIIRLLEHEILFFPCFSLFFKEKSIFE